MVEQQPQHRTILIPYLKGKRGAANELLHLISSVSIIPVLDLYDSFSAIIHSPAFAHCITSPWLQRPTTAASFRIGHAISARPLSATWMLMMTTTGAKAVVSKAIMSMMMMIIMVMVMLILLAQNSFAYDYGVIYCSAADSTSKRIMMPRQRPL
jgi:hypothetical protein